MSCEILMFMTVDDHFFSFCFSTDMDMFEKENDGGLILLIMQLFTSRRWL